MALIKTSFANSRPDAGLTLIEMLAALAIAATLMSFVAMSLAGSRGERTLDDAVNQLSTDLHAARTEARRRGEAISVTPTPGGYAIDALAVERRWQSGLEVRWDSPHAGGEEVEVFTFTPTRLGQVSLTVTLSQASGPARVLEVGAITGRVDAQ